MLMRGIYAVASRASVAEFMLVSPDSVTGVLYRQLQAAVNVSPRRFTVEQLSIESGVSVACIRSYMKGSAEERKEASLSKALSLAVVLGPRTVNSIMALIGYTAQAMDEPDTVQPMQVVANGLQQFSVIADAAVDNRITPDERDRVRDAADALIATVLPISSQGQAS